MSDGTARVTRRGFLVDSARSQGAGAVLGAMAVLDLAPRAAIAWADEALAALDDLSAEDAR